MAQICPEIVDRCHLHGSHVTRYGIPHSMELKRGSAETRRNDRIGPHSCDVEELPRSSFHATGTPVNAQPAHLDKFLQLAYYIALGVVRGIQFPHETVTVAVALRLCGKAL